MLPEVIQIQAPPPRINVFFLQLKKGTDLLWCVEEALKFEGLAAVVSEIQDLSFIESRRLQLVVEKSRVTGFLLRQNPKNFNTDTAVYEMITAADTVGVFQIESRAQMAMLPKVRPTCFYDLVIGVALGRTLGIPLFQEQVMEIAMVAGGFTPSEADQLRRSMVKREPGVAASFAWLVFISAWLKYYFPDVFAAAMLNSQPMGFYQEAQLLGDARKHGVKFRQVDVDRSQWDYILEDLIPFG